MTNTFLIGFAQIGSNSTCVQSNEVTKEQSSRHAQLGCAPEVYDPIDTWWEDENRGLEGNNAWRESDNRGLDGYSDYLCPHALRG
jgi:hypothetical protein